MILMDHHVKENEEEKNDKYMHFAAETREQLKVKTVIVLIVWEFFGQSQQNYQNHLKFGNRGGN